LILARASPDEYRELARAQVLGGEICWTQPTLHRGRLYVRNQSQAACLFLGEPDRLHAGTGTAALTVTDIPQSRYRDLAMLLGVEPEYAFDLPSDEWLRAWFVFGLIILATSGLLTAAGRLLFRSAHPIGMWWLFWGLAFLGGAAGTTLLSIARSDFTFTWPVCLFAAFQAVVYQSYWGTKRLVARPRLWSYLAALLFAGVCAGYFLLCRRLSLVTEWAFLFGFPAAFPFTAAAAYLSKGRWPAIAAVAGTAAGYSAYYWGSVALLAWKY
jgi:hypothetical protein